MNVALFFLLFLKCIGFIALVFSFDFDKFSFDVVFDRNVEYVSKYMVFVWFVPTKTIVKTPELTQLYVENVYQLYGLPANKVSDYNQKFESHF